MSTETTRSAEPRSAKELKAAVRFFIVYDDKGKKPLPFLDRKVAEVELAKTKEKAVLVESCDGKSVAGKVLAESMVGGFSGKAVQADQAKAKNGKAGKVPPATGKAQASAQTAQAKPGKTAPEPQAKPAKGKVPTAAPKAPAEPKAPKTRVSKVDREAKITPLVKAIDDVREGTVRFQLMDAIIKSKTVEEALTAWTLEDTSGNERGVKMVDIHYAVDHGYIKVG